MYLISLFLLTCLIYIHIWARRKKFKVMFCRRQHQSTVDQLFVTIWIKSTLYTSSSQVRDIFVQSIQNVNLSNVVWGFSNEKSTKTFSKNFVDIKDFVNETKRTEVESHKVTTSLKYETYNLLIWKLINSFVEKL